jgi:hypothetical protein
LSLRKRGPVWWIDFYHPRASEYVEAYVIREVILEEIPICDRPSHPESSRGAIEVGQFREMFLRQSAFLEELYQSPGNAVSWHTDEGRKLRPPLR